MKVFKMAGALMNAWRSKPVTLMYPDTEAKCFENTRGSIDADTSKCTMCGICAEHCPASAIEIDKEAEQWSIYRMQCVLCGQCVEVCPEDCLSMVNGYCGAENEKIQDVYDRAETEIEVAEAEVQEDVEEEPEAEDEADDKTDTEVEDEVKDKSEEQEEKQQKKGKKRKKKREKKKTV